MESNAIRHAIIALSFSALLFVIAGDSWSRNIGKLQPVRAVRKGE
jgi:hypothetical protein